jgi:hypothetical protein
MRSDTEALILPDLSLPTDFLMSLSTSSGRGRDLLRLNLRVVLCAIFGPRLAWLIGLQASEKSQVFDKKG